MMEQIEQDKINRTVLALCDMLLSKRIITVKEMEQSLSTVDDVLRLECVKLPQTP